MEKSAYNPFGKKDVPDAQTLLEKPEVVIVHLSLYPGECLKAHRTSVDVSFYVLEGEVIVHEGGKALMATKDELVFSAKNTVHYLDNQSAKTVRVLVIKHQKPLTPPIYV